MNPPNNFPSPYDPIPPAGGSGGGSPRPGVISTASINEAWGLLVPNLGAWLGALVITAVISGVFQFVQKSVQPPITPGTFPTPTFLGAIVMIVSYFVNIMIGGGLLKMAISTVRTGTSDIAEIFTVTDVIPNLFLAGILSTCAVAVGFVLCVLPAIYIGVALTFTQFLIVDQKMGAIDAMKASWEAVSPQWFQMLWLLIVYFFLCCLGFCALCLGVFVAIPLIYLSLAVVYRDLFGIESALPAPFKYPNAPISDPNA